MSMSIESSGDPSPDVVVALVFPISLDASASYLTLEISSRHSRLDQLMRSSGIIADLEAERGDSAGMQIYHVWSLPW